MSVMLVWPIDWFKVIADWQSNWTGLLRVFTQPILTLWHMTHCAVCGNSYTYTFILLGIFWTFWVLFLVCRMQQLPWKLQRMCHIVSVSATCLPLGTNNYMIQYNTKTFIAPNPREPKLRGMSTSMGQAISKLAYNDKVINTWQIC